MKYRIIALLVFLFIYTPRLILAQENTVPEQKEIIPVVEKKEDTSRAVNIGGYIQMWYIYEQVENGKRQDVTNDRAVQEASGFSINRARISLEGESPRINGRVELRLEGGSVGLLDAYAFFNVFQKMIQIGLGQMKIPSTYEVGISDSALDFATRSYFSSVTANWALSRSTSSVSPFYYVQTYQRDMGLALKGEIYGFSYFFMAGNGLGANLFVGGDENKQYAYSNGFGAYFYGARASFDLINPLGKKLIGSWPLTSFCIGGHYSRNRHPNFLFNDTKTVLDIKRESWSADVRIILFGRIRMTGMYGRGIIRDDFDNDNEPDYRYRGLEIKGIVEIIKNTLEAGFRYDTYTNKNSIFGAEETIKNYTAGITFTYQPHIKFQINYKWKRLDSTLNPDTDDDILTIAGQYRF